MNILVEIKSNYGQKVVYPVCDKARAFAKIAHTRTLTKDTIEQIKALGYEIEIDLPSFL